MLSSLRTRLTAIFTVLTVLVLTAAIGTAYYFSKEQFLKASAQRYEAAVYEAAELMRSGEAVSDNFLARLEAKTQSLIYIEDNGTPLSHSSRENTSPTRKTLALAAKEAALAAKLDLSYAHKREINRQINFTYSGKQYSAAVAYIPKAENKHVLLMQIRAKNADTAHISALLFKYGMLWLACSAALCAASFILCGAALRPTRLALKRQAEFTAAASHELRAPAAVISANLSALQHKDIHPQKAQEFLRSAYSEAQRLSRLASELTTLACFDTGQLVPLKEKINPDTVCIQLYEKYYSLCKENEHELCVCLPKVPCAEIISDKERLMQLLGIFVQNANSHTSPATKITITYTYTAHRICFEISDNGEGIASHDKPFIFERFYKADKSRTDKTHFGLGLSIAKQLAHDLRIKIDICDTLGGGATFKIIANI